MKREFNIEVIYVNSLEDFSVSFKRSQSRKLIIVSANPYFWLPILYNLKNVPIVFFLIGNELYQPKIFNALNSIPNLEHAFVYNLPNKISRLNLIGSYLGYVYDEFLVTTKTSGSSLRDFRIALSLNRKFKEIDIGFSASMFPQGYTNNFANKFAKLTGISPNESLLSKKVYEISNKFRVQKFDFAFIGQPTNRRREVFLKIAERFPAAKISYKTNFSGVTVDSDMEYLELLLASKFALIPPGFYNNFNHRYTESLITGSLPAILANNSLDPSINTNWTNHLAPARRYSIKFQLRFLSKLNDIQYEHYQNLARSTDFRAILDSRKLFDDVMG